jgi:acetolactate synthase-1/2/3 large subunit
MKGSDLVAKILKSEGVDFMGVIPFNRLEESGAKAGIRPLIFRQERVGVNLADGYSRITNGKKTGVFAMQAGPGAENAFAGVATAYADSVPILLLPASNPLNRHGLHPTFIPSETYSSVTKWASKIHVADSIPDMFRRGFGQLRNGKQGPVLIELPADLLTQEISDSLITDYQSPSVHKSSGDPQDIKQSAKLILSAKRPIIQSGQGVLYAEAYDELQELAELTGIPVMTTMAGKSSFNETHPLSLGTRSSTTTDMVVHFLKNSDLVLGIGCSFTRIHFGMNQFDSKTLIHITNSPDDLNKDYSPDHAVIGDAKLIMRQLIDEIKIQIKESVSFMKFDFTKEIRSVKESWFKEWNPRLTSNETPISPYRVIHELMQNTDPKQTIVTHDSGSPRDQIIPFYNAINPNGFIAWGKSTQLGYSLGLAMGAQMAQPQKVSVNIIGDYGFGMVGLDIETAVRENIPIFTIILNNSAMGIYRPDNFPTANDLYGTKYTTGNYSMIAEAMGSYNEKISSPENLASAIQRCVKIVKSGKPAVLEVMTKEEPEMPHRTF